MMWGLLLLFYSWFVVAIDWNLEKKIEEKLKASVVYIK
jgi:hypothetical protein